MKIDIRKICELEQKILSYAPSKKHDKFAIETIKEAIKAAKARTFGVGAILVHKETGTIMYRGHNKVFSEFRSDLHAEMDVLDSFEAKNKENSRKRIKEFTMYTSLESCPMCMHASIGTMSGCFLNILLDPIFMHASIGTMSGCFLNILLDPIFILPWGLNMGAEGAGLATFLSNCVACLYFFVLLYVKRGRTYVCVNPKMFSFKRHIVVGVCAVGIPASIQNLLNVTGMSVLNNFTSAFGSNAVAAMGIAQKINSVTVQIALGLSQGIMPLISYNYASGNIKRMKKTFFFTARIALVFLVLMEIAYYAGARTWVGLFMQDQQIVDYGARFLQGFCLGMPFLAIDFLAVGVFQACGLGKNAFLFAILRKVVLEIPALFILNALFPLYGLAYAQFAAELVLAIAAVIVLARLFRKLERRYQPKG